MQRNEDRADDDNSDTASVTSRKVKLSTSAVNSPVRRSTRLKKGQKESTPTVSSRNTRASSECNSPLPIKTRRTRASSVDLDEVKSSPKPVRKMSVLTQNVVEEETEVDNEKVPLTRKAAVTRRTLRKSTDQSSDSDKEKPISKRTFKKSTEQSSDSEKDKPIKGAKRVLRKSIVHSSDTEKLNEGSKDSTDHDEKNDTSNSKLHDEILEDGTDNLNEVFSAKDSSRTNTNDDIETTLSQFESNNDCDEVLIEKENIHTNREMSELNISGQTKESKHSQKDIDNVLTKVSSTTNLLEMLENMDKEDDFEKNIEEFFNTRSKSDDASLVVDHEEELVDVEALNSPNQLSTSNKKGVTIVSIKKIEKQNEIIIQDIIDDDKSETNQIEKTQSDQTKGIKKKLNEECNNDDIVFIRATKIDSPIEIIQPDKTETNKAAISQTKTGSPRRSRRLSNQFKLEDANTRKSLTKSDLCRKSLSTPKKSLNTDIVELPTDKNEQIEMIIVEPFTDKENDVSKLNVTENKNKEKLLNVSSEISPKQSSVESERKDQTEVESKAPTKEIDEKECLDDTKNSPKSRKHSLNKLEIIKEMTSENEEADPNESMITRPPNHEDDSDWKKENHQSEESLKQKTNSQKLTVSQELSDWNTEDDSSFQKSPLKQSNASIWDKEDDESMSMPKAHSSFKKIDSALNIEKTELKAQKYFISPDASHIPKRTQKLNSPRQISDTEDDQLEESVDDKKEKKIPTRKTLFEAMKKKCKDVDDTELSVSADSSNWSINVHEIEYDDSDTNKMVAPNSKTSVENSEEESDNEDVCLPNTEHSNEKEESTKLIDESVGSVDSNPSRMSQSECVKSAEDYLDDSRKDDKITNSFQEKLPEKTLSSNTSPTKIPSEKILDEGTENDEQQLPAKARTSTIKSDSIISSTESPKIKHCINLIESNNEKPKSPAKARKSYIESTIINSVESPTKRKSDTLVNTDEIQSGCIESPTKSKTSLDKLESPNISESRRSKGLISESRRSKELILENSDNESNPEKSIEKCIESVNASEDDTIKKKKLQPTPVSTTQTAEFSSDESSEDEMHRDIAKEYNLDGKMTSEYSDDNVSGDEVLSEEKSLDEEEDDDDDSFIVNDSEIEDEEDNESEEVDGKTEKKENEELIVVSSDDKEDVKEEDDTKEDDAKENDAKEVNAKEDAMEDDTEEEFDSEIKVVDQEYKQIYIPYKLKQDEYVEMIKCFDADYVYENKNISKNIQSESVSMSTPKIENDDLSLTAEKTQSATTPKGKFESRKISREESGISPRISFEEKSRNIKPSLSKTLLPVDCETPVTKHLKKTKMNDSEPIIKIPDDSFKKANKSEQMITRVDVHTAQGNISKSKSLTGKSKSLTEQKISLKKNEKLEEKTKKKLKNKNEQLLEDKDLKEVKLKEKNIKSRKTNDMDKKKDETQSSKKTMTKIQRAEDYFDKKLKKKSADETDRKRKIFEEKFKQEVESTKHDTEKSRKLITKKQSPEEISFKKKRKINDIEVSPKISETAKRSLKRRSDEFSKSFSEDVRVKKRRTEDYCASTSGSTTAFQVVVMKKIPKVPKNVVNVRQKLLARRQMQSHSAYYIHQEKLKASNKNLSS